MAAGTSLVESVYRQTWALHDTSGQMWKYRRILETISDPTQAVSGTKIRVEPLHSRASEPQQFVAERCGPIKDTRQKQNVSHVKREHIRIESAVYEE